MNIRSSYSKNLLTILIGVISFFGGMGIGKALQYVDSIGFSVIINNDVTTPNLSPLPLSLDGSTQVISWTTSSPLIRQRYTIEQATSESFLAIVQTLSIDNATTQTITALTPGRYCYRVRSTGIENLQVSAWSNVLCHDFGNAPVVAPPVVNLAGSTGAPVPPAVSTIQLSTASGEVSDGLTVNPQDLSSSGAELPGSATGQTRPTRPTRPNSPSVTRPSTANPTTSPIGVPQNSPSTSPGDTLPRPSSTESTPSPGESLTPPQPTSDRDALESSGDQAGGLLGGAITPNNGTGLPRESSGALTGATSSGQTTSSGSAPGVEMRSPSETIPKNPSQNRGWYVFGALTFIAGLLGFNFFRRKW